MRHTYDLKNLLIRSWGEPAKLVIGSFCSIADRVEIFLGGNHRSDWVTTFPFGHASKQTFSHHGQGHPTTNGDVTIGNDVWLCSRCTIMSGVTIGDGAVVAANAHVVTHVGPYEMVGGNPARLIKRRFTDQQIAALLKYPWWALADEQIATLVPALCSDDIDGAIQKIRKIYESAG